MDASILSVAPVRLGNEEQFRREVEQRIRRDGYAAFLARVSPDKVPRFRVLDWALIWLEGWRYGAQGYRLDPHRDSFLIPQKLRLFDEGRLQDVRNQLIRGYEAA